MHLNPIYLGAFLVVYYGIVEAKLIDIHISGPSEHSFMEECQREKENKKAQEVIEDPDSTIEEKDDAREILHKNGKIA